MMSTNMKMTATTKKASGKTANGEREKEKQEENVVDAVHRGKNWTNYTKAKSSKKKSQEHGMTCDREWTNKASKIYEQMTRTGELFGEWRRQRIVNEILLLFDFEQTAIDEKTEIDSSSVNDSHHRCHSVLLPSFRSSHLNKSKIFNANMRKKNSLIFLFISVFAQPFFLSSDEQKTNWIDFMPQEQLNRLKLCVRGRFWNMSSELNKWLRWRVLVYNDFFSLYISLCFSKHFLFFSK